MADTINLSDVSTKDDSKLKTGGRRKHTMAYKECVKRGAKPGDTITLNGKPYICPSGPKKKKKSKSTKYA